MTMAYPQKPAQGHDEFRAMDVRIYSTSPARAPNVRTSKSVGGGILIFLFCAPAVRPLTQFKYCGHRVQYSQTPEPPHEEGKAGNIARTQTTNHLGSDLVCTRWIVFEPLLICKLR